MTKIVNKLGFMLYYIKLLSNQEKLENPSVEEN